MALSIKSAETDRLARELAAVTGESITTAVSTALEERLMRVRRRPRVGKDIELEGIWRRASRLAPRSQATDDELLGHGDQGT